MKARFNLFVAGLAALLLGLPLAEKAMADSDTENIIGTSISAALAITDAALSAS